MRGLAFALLSGILAGCAMQSAGPLNADQARRAAEANTELAAYHLQHGAYADSLEKIERALTQSPELLQAHLVAAELHSHLDAPSRAERHYQKALAIAPNNGAALNNYAAFLCRRAEIDRALDLWTLAANNRLYEGRAMAMVNAGRCLADAQRWSAARRYWQRALEEQPDYPPALRGMAESASAMGDTDAANRWFSRYTAASGQSYDAERRTE